MKTYIITYDLNSPGQDYDALYDAIQQIGSWCHPQDSVWIVKTAKNITDTRDAIAVHLDANDSLFVAALTGESAWTGIPTECSSWLKSNL